MDKLFLIEKSKCYCGNRKDIVFNNDTMEEKEIIYCFHPDCKHYSPEKDFNNFTKSIYYTENNVDKNSKSTFEKNKIIYNKHKSIRDSSPNKDENYIEGYHDGILDREHNRYPCNNYNETEEYKRGFMKGYYDADNK